jgi:hypothetical protein
MKNKELIALLAECDPEKKIKIVINNSDTRKDKFIDELDDCIELEIIIPNEFLMVKNEPNIYN